MANGDNSSISPFRVAAFEIKELAGFDYPILASEETAELLRAKALELNDYNESGEAAEFARVLEQLVRTQIAPRGDEAVMNVYNQILALFRTVSFHNLTEELQKEIFNKNLAAVTLAGLDPREKLEMWSSIFMDDAGFGDLCGKLARALEQSEETIGRQQMVTREMPQGTLPAIKNWLLEYKRFIFGKPQHSKVDQAAFLSQDTNVRNLEPQEREALLKILDLYDWMRTTATSAPKAATPVSTAPKPAPVFQPAPTPSVRPVIQNFKAPPAPPTPPRPRPVYNEEAKPEAPKAAGPSDLEVDAALQRILRSPRVPGGPGYFSLSQSIVNAGQDNTREQGDMRKGKSEGLPQGPKPQTPAPVPAPKAVIPVPPAPKPGSPTPPPPSVSAQAGQKSSASEASAPPLRKEELDYPPFPKGSPAVSAGRDLSASAKSTLEIKSINEVSDLQKLEVKDFRKAGFEDATNQLKKMIPELADKAKVTKKEALNAFYRSPLYNLYVSMAVAVMNDVSSDQKTAFDKVVKNYQAAGRDCLTREEFLALNRFKKEMAQSL